MTIEERAHALIRRRSELEQSSLVRRPGSVVLAGTLCDGIHLRTWLLKGFEARGEYGLHKLLISRPQLFAVAVDHEYDAAARPPGNVLKQLLTPPTRHICREKIKFARSRDTGECQARTPVFPQASKSRR